MKKLNSLSLFSWILFIVFLCNACGKNSLIQKNEKTLIIAHRSTGIGVNDGFLENTAPAIREALKYADGVEADVQMSSSKTVWLYHGNLGNYLCDTSHQLLKANGYNCIPHTPDSILEKVRICRGGIKERLYKLEELFAVLSEDKTKIASLFVKGYFEENCMERNNVDEAYLNSLAKGIEELVEKYRLKNQIIVESSYVYILKRLKKNKAGIQSHYVVYDKLKERLDDASAINADGLSINCFDQTFKAADFQLAQSENFDSQLWTIHNKSELDYALDLHPYAIQLSNLKLLRNIQEFNPQGSKSTLFH